MQISQKILFIVPAFGESNHLSECLDSLINQTISNDIIITTSTPSDFLEAIATKYKISLFLNADGGSIAKDWNFAFRQGQRELIVLAHQDDIYDKNYAKKALDFFKNYPNCALAFTDAKELIEFRVYKYNIREMVKKLLRKLAFFNQVTINSSIRFRVLLGFGCSIPCPSVIYNKKILQEFRFTDELSLNLDWDAWYRISKANNLFGYIPEDLITHRIHADAETQKGLMDNRRQDEDLILFKRYWPTLFSKMLLKIYRFGY